MPSTPSSMARWSGRGGDRRLEGGSGGVAGETGWVKWSYFVGQSEGKAKVDSDWFWEPSGAFALFCLEWDSTVCGPLGQGEGRIPG